MGKEWGVDIAVYPSETAGSVKAYALGIGAEAGPADQLVYRFGAVAVQNSVIGMDIEQAPDRMQSADYAQSVRTQCGRHADNFRTRK
jgi:hypothetical protein